MTRGREFDYADLPPVDAPRTAHDLARQLAAGGVAAAEAEIVDGPHKGERIRVSVNAEGRPGDAIEIPYRPGRDDTLDEPVVSVAPEFVVVRYERMRTVSLRGRPAFLYAITAASAETVRAADHRAADRIVAAALAKLPPEPDPTPLELRIAEILERELPPGEKLHGWRCEHPDRWPEPCGCALALARVISAGILAPEWRPTPGDPSKTWPFTPTGGPTGTIESA